MSTVPNTRRTTASRAGLFLLLAAAGVGGCEAVSSPPEVTARNEVTSGTGGIGGRVTDLNGNPVGGATVRTATGVVTQTGSEGTFAIQGLPAAERLAVSVEARGFGTATRIYPVVAGQQLTQPIPLVPSAAPVRIDAQAGGVVPIAGGGRITIPSGSLVNAAGQPVTGPVDVRTTYWDPSSQAQVRAAPGDFSAVQLNGSTAQLETFGMLQSVVTDGAGQPVELAPGRSATINFPVRNPIGATPPPLYDFDAQTGRWVEVGPTVLAPDTTVQVRVPSLAPRRNLDKPFVRVCVTVALRWPGGAPRPYEFASATGLTYAGTSSGFTDAQGLVKLWVRSSSIVSVQGGPASQNVNTPASNVGCPLVATLTY